MSRYAFIPLVPHRPDGLAGGGLQPRPALLHLPQGWVPTPLEPRRLHEGVYQLLGVEGPDGLLYRPAEVPQAAPARGDGPLEPVPGLLVDVYRGLDRRHMVHLKYGIPSRSYQGFEDTGPGSQVC